MTKLVSSCNGFQSSLFHVGLCLCLGGTPVLALGMGGASPCFLLPSLLQVSARSRSKGQESNTPSFFASSFLGTNFTLLVFLCLPKTGAASSSSSSPSLYYNVVRSARILPKHHFSIYRTCRKKAVWEVSLPMPSVVILYRATRESREYLRLLVHASLLQNSITVPVHMSQFRLNETRSVYRSSGSIIHTQGGRCSQA